MKGFTLLAEEIDGLHAAHKSAQHKKHAYKLNAIILLGSGWTLEEVSEALLLDSETLRHYVELYKTNGLKDLLSTAYKGSSPKLSEEQLLTLREELDTNIYMSTKLICAYVQLTFNVTYSISGMTDLLHRLDYVYKKPKLVPSKGDEEDQSIFLAQYEAFMKDKPDDALVFFADGVHPVHNALAGYGWMQRGEIRELKSNSGRQRLNIHGAMNAETFETTVVMGEDSVNSETSILLFETLEKLYPMATIIYVILDNAGYHFAHAVQKWLANSRIQLIPLPTYSPQLNLIERLWKVFKKNVIYNKFYETFDDFKLACMGFFKNQAGYYDQIVSIMGNGLEALI